MTDAALASDAASRPTPSFRTGLRREGHRSAALYRPPLPLPHHAPQSLRFRGRVRHDRPPQQRAPGDARLLHRLAVMDEELEFFSIKVPNGPLTEHLQKIKVGDNHHHEAQATGTLVNDALIKGSRSSASPPRHGLRTFASLIRDPRDLREVRAGLCHAHLPPARRAQVFRRHGAQHAQRSAGGEIARAISTTPLDDARRDRTHAASPSCWKPRLLRSMKIAPLKPETDRSWSALHGLHEGYPPHRRCTGLQGRSNSEPATYVVERAFVG